MRTIWEIIGDGSEVELLDFLRANPNEANVASSRGMVPTILAVQTGAVEKARILLANGADVNRSAVIRSPVSGRVDAGVVPIMFVSTVEMLNLLIDAGARVDIADSVGKTVFLRVASSFNTELAERLVQLGARPQKSHLEWLASNAEEERSFRQSTSARADGRISMLLSFEAWCKAQIGT